MTWLRPFYELAWLRVIAAYIVVWLAVEIARPFANATQLLWAHDLLLGLGLSSSVVVFSLLVREWTEAEP
jgi:hypothetical protein